MNKDEYKELITSLLGFMWGEGYPVFELEGSSLILKHDSNTYNLAAEAGRRAWKNASPCNTQRYSIDDCSEFEAAVYAYLHQLIELWDNVDNPELS